MTNRCFIHTSWARLTNTIKLRNTDMNTDTRHEHHYFLKIKTPIQWGTLMIENIA